MIEGSVIWTELETQELLNIWQRSDTQLQLQTLARNGVIWEAIAEELLERGFCRSARQCRSKINNLLSTYRKVSRGEMPRSRCRHFGMLHKMVLTRPEMDLEAINDPWWNHRRKLEQLYQQEMMQRSDIEHAMAQRPQPTDQPAHKQLESGPQNSWRNNLAQPQESAVSSTTQNTPRRIPQNSTVQDVRKPLPQLVPLQSKSPDSATPVPKLTEPAEAAVKSKPIYKRNVSPVHSCVPSQEAQIKRVPPPAVLPTGRHVVSPESVADSSANFSSPPSLLTVAKRRFSETSSYDATHQPSTSPPKRPHISRPPQEPVKTHVSGANGTQRKLCPPLRPLRRQSSDPPPVRRRTPTLLPLRHSSSSPSAGKPNTLPSVLRREAPGLMPVNGSMSSVTPAKLDMSAPFSLTDGKTAAPDIAKPETSPLAPLPRGLSYLPPLPRKMPPLQSLQQKQSHLSPANNSTSATSFRGIEKPPPVPLHWGTTRLPPPTQDTKPIVLGRDVLPRLPSEQDIPPVPKELRPPPTGQQHMVSLPPRKQHIPSPPPRKRAAMSPYGDERSFPATLYPERFEENRSPAPPLRHWSKGILVTVPPPTVDSHPELRQDAGQRHHRPERASGSAAPVSYAVNQVSSTHFVMTPIAQQGGGGPAACRRLPAPVPAPSRTDEQGQAGSGGRGPVQVSPAAHVLRSAPAHNHEHQPRASDTEHGQVPSDTNRPSATIRPVQRRTDCVPPAQPLHSLRSVPPAQPPQNLRGVPPAQPLQRLRSVPPVQPIQNLRSVPNVQPLQSLPSVPPLQPLQRRRSVPPAQPIHRPLCVRPVQHLHQHRGVPAAKPLHQPRCVQPAQPLQQPRFIPPVHPLQQPRFIPSVQPLHPSHCVPAARPLQQPRYVPTDQTLASPLSHRL